MKTLMHICCAPCANQPIQVLRQEGIELSGFWFNPHGKEPRADIRPGYTIRALSELLPLLGSMQ